MCSYKTINSNAELAAEIESAKTKPVIVAVLADHNGPVAQQFFTAAQDDTSGAVFLIASPGSVTDGLPATDSIVMKVVLLSAAIAQPLFQQAVAQPFGLHAVFVSPSHFSRYQTDCW